MSIEVKGKNSTDIVAYDTNVLVNTNEGDLTVDSNGFEVEAYVNQWNICSDNIFLLREGEAPAWVIDLIDGVVVINPTITDMEAEIDAMQAWLTTLDTGYNELVVENATQTVHITTLYNDLETEGITRAAAIGAIEWTLVNDYQSQAGLYTAIGAWMSGAEEGGAWWSEKITATSSNIASIAQSVVNFRAELNGNTADITEINEAYVTLNESVARASQYATATFDGTEVITGWAMASEVDAIGNQISEFAIYADKFFIFNSAGDDIEPVFTITDGIIYIGEVDTSVPSFEMMGYVADITELNTKPQIKNQIWGVTSTGYSYFWDGDSWEVFGLNGIDGVDGAGLYNEFAYSTSSTTGVTGGAFDGSVFTYTTMSPGTWYNNPDDIPGIDLTTDQVYMIRSTWEESGGSWTITIAGWSDPAKWNGLQGDSLVWKGSLATAPSSPQDNWAYYNTTDLKSYVYYDSAWHTMAIDGTNGVDGESFDWKGDFTDPPENPEIGWVYRDTDNGIVYVCVVAGDPATWEVFAQDGEDGDDSIILHVVYHSNDIDDEPNKPTTVGGLDNDWYEDAIADSNWMSQKVDDGTTALWGDPILMTGDVGPDGPAGASSYISNDYVGGKYGPINYKRDLDGNWINTDDTYISGHFIVDGVDHYETTKIELNQTTGDLTCSLYRNITGVTTNYYDNGTRAPRILIYKYIDGVMHTLSQTLTSIDDGERGSLFFSKNIFGLSPDDSWSDTHANQAVTDDGAIVHKYDRVQLYNNSEEYSETKYWNGSAWTEVVEWVDGNLVVTGTIDTPQLAADAITAEKINAGEITATKINSDSLIAVAGPYNDSGSVTTAFDNTLSGPGWTDQLTVDVPLNKTLLLYIGSTVFGTVNADTDKSTVGVGINTNYHDVNYPTSPNYSLTQATGSTAVGNMIYRVFTHKNTGFSGGEPVHVYTKATQTSITSCTYASQITYSLQAI